MTTTIENDQYHSRFDTEHTNKCDDCYADYLDFQYEPEFAGEE